MRIERISPNQIRCTLSGADLGNRNINIGELTYGSDKARALFQEMLMKASYEVGFNVEDSPLMVEAIPLSNDSIIIYVTKVDDPEELDTRFSKFSLQQDETDNFFDIKENNLLEGASDLNKSTNFQGNVQNDNSPSSPYIRAYSFRTLDEFINAAKAVGPYSGENTLYKDEEKNLFILVLKNIGEEKKDFTSAANILSEYGTKLNVTTASESYYNEHFKILVKQNAIVSLMNM